jgi:hypothetical protein
MTPHAENQGRLNTNWATTAQQLVPTEVIARFRSFDYLLSFTAMPVGYAIAGPLASAFGAGPVLTIAAGVIVACAVVPALLPPVRAVIRHTTARSPVHPPPPGHKKLAAASTAHPPRATPAITTVAPVPAATPATGTVPPVISSKLEDIGPPVGHFPPTITADDLRRHESGATPARPLSH